MDNTVDCDSLQGVDAAGAALLAIGTLGLFGSLLCLLFFWVKSRRSPREFTQSEVIAGRERLRQADEQRRQAEAYYVTGLPNY